MLLRVFRHGEEEKADIWSDEAAAALSACDREGGGGIVQRQAGVRVRRKKMSGRDGESNPWKMSEACDVEISNNREKNRKIMCKNGPGRLGKISWRCSDSGVRGGGGGLEIHGENVCKYM